MVAALLGAVTPAIGKKPLAPPPIVVPVSAPPAESFQDWTVDRFGSFTAAYTTNNVGSVFGLLCASDSCSIYVNLQTSCETDGSYPMMMNSAAGAYPLTFKCHVIPRKADPAYVLVTDATVGPEAFAGGQIGFAEPMASGEFTVSRFSTLGARAAMARAMQRAGVKPKPETRSDQKTL